MCFRFPVFIVGFLLLPLLGLGEESGDAVPAFSAEDLAFFETSIRPVLAESCYACHGQRKQSVGLRLDSRGGVLRGSDYRKVIDLANPKSSLLMVALRHESKDIKPMPEDEPKLLDRDIAAFEKWISLGLPWPEEETPHSPDKKAELAETHWAFQPIAPPALPEDLAVHPIDHWLAAKREGVVPQNVVAPPEPSTWKRIVSSITGATEETPSLETAPQADPAKLLRRVSYGLTGLPPSAEEVRAFVANPDLEAKIEELLARPQYGEHWGRHWLDVARYADTMGYVAGGKDNRYPYAYTYRDWVVRAMNDDLPYDEFIRLQIAADHLRPEDHPDQAALGFLTVGRQANILDVVDDQIDVVTRGVLGLTVSCARCHDHKFDPIPTRDYYALQGVFRSSVEPKELPVIGYPEDKKAVADYEKARGEIEAEALAFQREIYDEVQTVEKIAAHLQLIMKLRDQPLPEFDRKVQGAGLRRSLGRKWREFAVRQRSHAMLAPFEALWALPENASPEAYRATQANVPKNVAPGPLLAWNWQQRHPVTNRKTLAESQARFFLHYAATDESNPAAQQVRNFVRASPLGVPVERTNEFFTQIERGNLEKIQRRLVKLDIESPGAPIRAMVMNDVDNPRDFPILVRGQASRPGDKAERTYLTILGNEPLTDGSGRKQLADALVSPESPLTARVLVNRVWGWHFGRPLVDTPSDFGVQTEPPLHQELLDYLANWFQTEGELSLKKLHRHLLTSEAYQLSSDHPDAESDPENRYVTRYVRHRLGFEAMRDSILLASNSLEPEIGGRPVNWDAPEADRRRSIYGFIDRYRLAPVLATFDFPNPDLHSPARYETSVPQQTLFLLNSPFVLRHAEQIEKLATQVGQPDQAGVPIPERSLHERIDFVYEQTLKRTPSEDEREMALSFLENGIVEPDNPTPGTWEYLLSPAKLSDSGELELGTAEPLPHFHEKRQTWQLGEACPTPEGNYVNLSPRGGHTAPPDQAILLRLIADQAGEFVLEGEFRVPGPSTDGIRLMIRRNEEEIVREIQVPAFGRIPLTNTPPLQLEAGDRLDFIVHANRSANSDTFYWDVALRKVASDPARKTQIAARSAPDFNYTRDILAGTNGPGSWTYWMADLQIGAEGSPKLENFKPIRFLDDESLKLTPRSQFPVSNSDLGYLSLYPTGGHPGEDGKVVVRRWRANADGRYRVDGELFRPSKEGDGIRALIVKNGADVLGDFVIGDTRKQPTKLNALDMKAGTTLDFIVSANGTSHYDGFHWTMKVERLDAEGKVNYTSVSDREFEIFAKIKRGEVVPGRWNYLHATLENPKNDRLPLKNVAELPQRDPRGNLRLASSEATPLEGGLQHLHLSGDGGHPGAGNHVAVRRWEPDRNGTVSITAPYRKHREGGDGITFVVRHSRLGVLFRDEVDGAEIASIPLNLNFVDVRSGDTIDFIAMPRENPSFDEYSWAPVIVWEPDANPPGKIAADYDRDFLGPHGVPLSHRPDQYPWAALAQTLLISNEFMFVD